MFANLHLFSPILSSSLFVALSGCQGKCGDTNNIPFSFGMFVLAPILVNTWIVWTQLKRKLEYHRTSLFDRNGCNLLMKKLSRRKKSANSQLKDMKNATCSDRKVMQRCNSGTFYRGNLSDGPNNRVVACKHEFLRKMIIFVFIYFFLFF